MRFTLSQKSDTSSRRRRVNLRAGKPTIESLEGRALLSTFTVTNSNDNGNNGYLVPGSLRSAIINSNANPAQNDVNHIDFELPYGKAAIVLSSSLPTITAPVLIDGYTQAGSHPNTLFQGNNAFHAVRLLGDGAYTGLYIGGSNVTVRGLEIAEFKDAGISVFPGAVNTVIQGNEIDNNGGDGIRVQSSNNVIGGEINVDADNVIFSNKGSGVVISGSPLNPAENNFVGGNSIGEWGGNGGAGIKLDGAKLNQIGGAANALAGNAIANNTGPGVTITGSGSQYNFLGGNDIHSNYDGVYVTHEAANNFIGTGQPQWSNTIHANGFYGVVLANGTTNNFVARNSIYDNYVGILNGKTANQGLQPPVVTSAVEDASSMTITGSFHGAANTEYEIDFYDSPNMDHYRDEGMNYLYAIGVMTDAQGNANYVAQVPKSVKVGDAITAQAGGSAGYSAFSQPAYVTKMEGKSPRTGGRKVAGETVGDGLANGASSVEEQAHRLTDAALQVLFAELDGVSTLDSHRRTSR